MQVKPNVIYFTAAQSYYKMLVGLCGFAIGQFYGSSQLLLPLGKGIQVPLGMAWNSHILVYDWNDDSSVLTLSHLYPFRPYDLSNRVHWREKKKKVETGRVAQPKLELDSSCNPWIYFHLKSQTVQYETCPNKSGRGGSPVKRNSLSSLEIRAIIIYESYCEIKSQFFNWFQFWQLTAKLHFLFWLIFKSYYNLMIVEFHWSCS